MFVIKEKLLNVLRDKINEKYSLERKFIAKLGNREDRGKKPPPVSYKKNAIK